MKLKPATRQYSQGARAQAARANGQRIVDAFLKRLMTHWFDEITLDCIAEDAGVTVQTVVRRFGGKEGLLAAAVQIMAAQINAQRAAPAADIDRLVENLVADYERTGDAVIRLLALAPRHPALQEAIEYGQGQHRQWVSGSFADSLARLDNDTRLRAIDALVITTDVYTWKLLRRDMGRNVSAVKSTIKHLIRATVNEFSTTN